MLSSVELIGFVLLFSYALLLSPVEGVELNLVKSVWVLCFALVLSCVMLCSKVIGW